MRRGSEERTDLIERHRHLVPRTRARVFPRLPCGVEADDLDGAGYAGLVQAADEYQPALRSSFRNYAIDRIRWAMLRYLRQEDWLPQNVRRRVLRGELENRWKLISLDMLLCGSDEDDQPPARLVDPCPEPEEEVVRAVYLEQLLARARPEDRQLLERRYLEDEPVTKLAREADISETQVYNHIRRGLYHIREAIKER